MEALIYFWDHRTVFIGRLSDIKEHRLASAALAVGLEKDFRIYDTESDLDQTCRSVLIPPGFSHVTHYDDQIVAVISLEPESNDYSIVRQLMKKEITGCYFDLKNERDVIETMKAIYKKKLGASESSHQLNALLYIDEPDMLEPKPLDRRIRQAMETMKQNPAQSHSLEFLADNAYLSTTRFTHLFKDETGVPIRRYRQWLRFRQAIQLITSGETMTTAAVKAGFTDSAHFSRAFRSMFGIKPSVVFRKTRPVTLFIG